MEELQELDINLTEPRSVAELLKLNTYQDMTDAEIESLIDYKIQNALIDDERQQVIEAKIAQDKIALDILAEAQLMAQQTFEKRVHLPVEYRTVTDNDA